MDLDLHPKQSEAFDSEATEILYGGAAGGGKSFLMRVAAIAWCVAINGLQVYLFRRISDDLIKNHMEGPKGFRSMLSPWATAGWCKIVDDEIRFFNGSKIYLCHCKDEKDIYKYQGAEIHVLLIDELTHWTEVMYRFLRNRVRMVGLEVPAQFSGVFPRILCGANPGNIGHLWVKRTFITDCQPMEIRRMPAAEGAMLRQYIPARLDDNPSMAEDDPGYEGRLEGLGSAALVKAMRWGDWDVVEGAFFDCWDNHKHVIAPFAIPHGWVRIRSGDWGSVSPFSFGWWAVVQDDFLLPSDHRGISGTSIGTIGVGGIGYAGDAHARSVDASDGARCRTIPRGALVRYREWYGKPNHKLTAEQMGAGIVQRERGERIAYAVLDPRCFAVESGPSIAERINRPLIDAGTAPFRAADNKRVSTASKDGNGPLNGWDQMRARMVGKNDVPMIYWFSTCHDSIRTIPVLQHDAAKVEDLDTNGEDHAADDCRYVCSSRPWIKTVIVPDAPRDAYRAPKDGVDDVQSSVKLL